VWCVCVRCQSCFEVTCLRCATLTLLISYCIKSPLVISSRLISSYLILSHRISSRLSLLLILFHLCDLILSCDSRSVIPIILSDFISSSLLYSYFLRLTSHLSSPSSSLPCLLSFPYHPLLSLLSLAISALLSSPLPSFPSISSTSLTFYTLRYQSALYH
jgi:hypothetical protein